MLTIVNPDNQRQTDYAKQQLVTEARYMVRHAADSDGKLRAWHLLVIGRSVVLCADYLTTDGEAKTARTEL